jgi:hypothetical protein
VFELIVEKMPDLKRLQQKVSNLEQERGEAEARVMQLRVQVQDERSSDLDREAAALNAGTRVPKPRAPELQSQLEGAERRLEVLGRRVGLAQADLSRFLSENAQDLARLLQQVEVDKAREVALLAEPLAKALHELQLPGLDARALRPYLEGPAPENTGEPESTITVMGPYNRQNAGGGERVAGQTIGQVEAIVAELVGLATRYEQGDVTVVGPTEDEGAA